jgi:putative endonuclease
MPNRFRAVQAYAFGAQPATGGGRRFKARIEHWTFSAAAGSGTIRGMGDPRHVLGRAAEEAAAKLLERSGLRVVARNVKLRHGEIDLICRDREVWVFVEVKCRQERWDDGPAAAVSWWKRRRLIRLAQGYLKWMRIDGAHCRFDVVAVTPRGDGRFEIRHIPAAFDATGIV